MALKPELSFGASIAVLALDYGIFQLHLPSTGDIRNLAPHNSHVNGSRNAAAWTAIGASSALSLLARDPNIFIFGAGFAVVLDWFYRHANSVSNSTGEVTFPPPGGMLPGGVNGGY